MHNDETIGAWNAHECRQIIVHTLSKYMWTHYSESHLHHLESREIIPSFKQKYWLHGAWNNLGWKGVILLSLKELDPLWSHGNRLWSMSYSKECSAISHWFCCHMPLFHAQMTEKNSVRNAKTIFPKMRITEIIKRRDTHKSQSARDRFSTSQIWC